MTGLKNNVVAVFAAAVTAVGLMVGQMYLDSSSANAQNERLSQSNAADTFSDIMIEHYKISTRVASVWAAKHPEMREIAQSVISHDQRQIRLLENWMKEKRQKPLGNP